jgi:FkbH-like protein
MTGYWNPKASPWSRAGRIQAQTDLLGLRWSRLDFFSANSELESDLIRPERSFKPCNIVVYRNVAVEPLIPIANVFFAFAGLKPTWQLAEYDDSLLLLPPPGVNQSEIAVVVFDRERFKGDDQSFLTWIQERLETLSRRHGNSVVAVTFSSQETRNIRFMIGAHFIEDVFARDGQEFTDPRLEKLTGSSLTAVAWMHIARNFVTRLAYRQIAGPRKLLVVDMDNTLHDGVIGEDGLGVRVSDAHKLLQDELRQARSRGYLLALLSKNDLGDVLRTLAEHPDYQLRPSDFLTIDASWDDKAVGMKRILDMARVGSDSAIFLDDNPAELLGVGDAWPQIALVNAGDGPETTLENLRFCPGYLVVAVDEAATSRQDDLKANALREELLQVDSNAYIREAQPVLSIRLNHEEDLSRLVDLGGRSNQFNLLLKRWKLNDYLHSDCNFAALSLRDRFSDSGVIGGIAVLSNSDTHEATVSELFLSCRVLGRHLETPLIMSALRRMLEERLQNGVWIEWTVTERNQPALSWLQTLPTEVDPSRPGRIFVSRNQIESLSQIPEGVEREYV